MASLTSVPSLGLEPRRFTVTVFAILLAERRLNGESELKGAPSVGRSHLIAAKQQRYRADNEPNWKSALKVCLCKPQTILSGSSRIS